MKNIWLGAAVFLIPLMILADQETNLEKHFACYKAILDLKGIRTGNYLVVPGNYKGSGFYLFDQTHASFLTDKTVLALGKPNKTVTHTPKPKPPLELGSPPLIEDTYLLDLAIDGKPSEKYTYTVTTRVSTDGKVTKETALSPVPLTKPKKEHYYEKPRHPKENAEKETPASPASDETIETIENRADPYPVTPDANEIRNPELNASIDQAIRSQATQILRPETGMRPTDVAKVSRVIEAFDKTLPETKKACGQFEGKEKTADIEATLAYLQKLEPKEHAREVGAPGPLTNPPSTPAK